MTKKMEPGDRGSNVFVRMLPGLFISAVSVALLSLFVDLDELRHALTLADYRWLPLVLVPFIGTLSARSKAWQTLLEEKASFKDSFFALNQGYLLNNLLPFRLGELGRALLLGERSDLSFWRVLSTVVVERVFDLGFAALLLLIGIPFVVEADWARSASLVALAVVLFGFAFLFLMARSPDVLISFVNKIAKSWPKTQTWIVSKMESFFGGLGALRDFGRFLKVFFWLGLAWFFNLAWYYILLRAFFPSSEWLWAIMAVGVGSLGVALPSSPAYIGVLEGAVVAALSLFGVDPSLSLAYALVAHALYFVVTGILGAWGFSQQGRSLKNVYQRLLKRPSPSND
jgi:hypothetical protein